MSTNGDSLAERVQSCYLQLSSVASDLNTVSNELGKSIAEIDGALKKLNLGVSVWVNIRSWDGDDLDYFMERIGYAKVDGKWGIALQTIAGNQNCPADAVVEQWLFNDGPRKLRLSAIQKLPEMLKSLSEEAAETTKKIKAKLAEVKEVAEAVKDAAEGHRRGSQVSSSGQIEALRLSVLAALVDGNQGILASMLEGGEWNLRSHELVIVVAESQTVVDMSFGADARRLAITAASEILGHPIKVNIVPSTNGVSSVDKQRKHSGGAGPSAKEQKK